VATYPIALIDLAAVQHNLKRVRDYAPNSRIMSVIKANAYGHGAVEIATALTDSDAFSVARLAEGIELRQAGIKKPIVILEGVQTEHDFQQAAHYALSLVFHHWSQVECVCSIQLDQPLSFCWLMIETGMNRLGLSIDKVADAISLLANCSNIAGEVGVMSHFANADNIDDPHNIKQLNTFKQLTQAYALPTSLANSAAVISLTERHGDWVRPGLMLYGISPFEQQSANDLGLKPVMKLQASLIAIQALKKGDTVGYGATWVADKAIQIGIVSVGYADGYSRQLSNCGQVLVADKLACVVGRVSMDMIAIDLTDVDAKIGDDVILWGHHTLTAETVAEQAGTIAYELVCQVSPRVERKYHYG